MSLAADVGGIFIVLHATTFASAHIFSMTERRPWETEWTVFSSL